MKKYTLGSNTILVVPVEYGAQNICVVYPAGLPEERGIQRQVPFKEDGYSGNRMGGEHLPTGKWNYIGIAKDLSEEQCAQIVPYDADEAMFFHYKVSHWWCMKARESFNSWLIVNGIEPNSAILKLEE